MGDGTARTPHGVLIVDKPAGMTSHDVVARVRRCFGTRAVGHAGTLDPMATGVLVVLLGEATKLSHYLTQDSKRYRATIAFGRATDTLDALGATLEERTLTAGFPDHPSLREALAVELARTEQTPPAYSAISVNGQRSHALARRGHAPELAPRAIKVHALTLVERGNAFIVLELHVSKGYYVRSLARDLGSTLGAPAHLAELRRLASGTFELSDAAPWPLSPDPPLLSIHAAAQRALPCAQLTPTGEHRARGGLAVGESDFLTNPRGAHARGPVVAWFTQHGELIALGEQRSAEEFRVVRGFSAAIREPASTQLE